MNVARLRVVKWSIVGLGAVLFAIWSIKRQVSAITGRSAHVDRLDIYLYIQT